MAYRKSKGKMSRRSKKIEPAVQTMYFNYSVPAGVTQNDTIDLSQCASLLNRRFYRQGINWAVSSIKVITSGSQTGLLVCEKLPETWVMSNAWEKSFRAWQRMNDEALEENESAKPRFLDFKVYADQTHHIAGAGANLLPTNDALAGTPATAGEWKYSKVAIPDNTVAVGEATDYEFVAVGPSYPGVSPATTLDAVSLIEGYASSRALPSITDPNLPGDADDVGPEAVNPQNWISSVFTEGTEQQEDVLDRLTGENNVAPYPFEGATVGGVTFTDTYYPGGANQLTGLQVHDLDTVTGTTVGGVSRIKGGLFPCGLIRMTVANTSVDTSMGVNLLIELVPGHHRGYLCEPMTDM